MLKTEKMDYDDESNAKTLGWHINAKSVDDFVSKLEEKLGEKLHDHDRLEHETRKDRRAIFSQCFEEIIRHSRCFGPLLSAIKLEYETCIRAVLQSQNSEDFIRRNVKNYMYGLETIKNYQKRIEELAKKIQTLVDENARLRVHSEKGMPGRRREDSEQILHDLRKSIATIRGRDFQQNLFTKNECFGKFRVKILQRYTSREQTDVIFLKQEWERLRKEVQELVKFFDKRFRLRKTKDKLIEKLMEKEKLKHDLKIQGDMLKEKLLKLEEKVKEERRKRDLERTKKPTTILQLILLALKHSEAESDIIEGLEDKLMKESCEKEMQGEQEQDEMVEHMEKFEELFTQRRYEEAAAVAASSPQDILRTAQTFERFKQQNPLLGEMSPLLHYCEAIITNSENTGQKGLSASESIDAIVRALSEKRQDLVMQWFTQNKLKYSDTLGDCILQFCKCKRVCKCGCHIMAEIVYRHAKAHEKVVSSLCRQGRLHMAASHARNVAKFNKTDFMRILEAYPSYRLAEIFLLTGDGYLSSPLNREECITSLVRACRPSEAVRLLHTADDRIQCTKVLSFIFPEHEKEWYEFYKELGEFGRESAALDMLTAWVLSSVFTKAMIVSKLQ